MMVLVNVIEQFYSPYLIWTMFSGLYEYILYDLGINSQYNTLLPHLGPVFSQWLNYLTLMKHISKENMDLHGIFFSMTAWFSV